MALLHRSDLLSHGLAPRWDKKLADIRRIREGVAAMRGLKLPRGLKLHRRSFLAALGAAALTWPKALLAQSAPPLVVFLNNGSESAFAAFFAAFRRGVRETGLVEGRSVSIEARWADGHDDRLPALIAEIAQRRPAVLAATGGSASTVAAKSVSTEIPIVFVMGADPIRLGLVKSLNKPEANLTGVSMLSNGLLEKQVAILHETVAKGVPLGFLVRPANPNADNDTRRLIGASEELGHQLMVGKADSLDQIAPAIADLAQRGAKAVVVFPDVLFITGMKTLVAAITQHRLPAIYNFSEFTSAGGLLCYGANQNDAYHQAGVYAGRILKGEKASDLPVMQSSRWSLIVNLKTAKAFGLTLSPTLLATADETIE
jgi:putative ABC transport system substrate-binding protein